jgi:iron complex outermembrane receptor protein
VTFTSFLDIGGLPDRAKGFGVQANGTYIDAKGDLAPDQALTFGNEQQPFRGVSKSTYNVVALYEKPQFSARLAYNYRSRFVTLDPAYTFQTFDPIAHPVIERGRGQLDFSTTVTPLPNITVAFDIINLLGNPLRRYRQYDTGDSFARQVLYIERAYSLGVRFRF